MTATSDRENTPNDLYAAEREQMIEQQLRRRGIVRHSVLEAMRDLPRHLFVTHEYSARAYADEALPSMEGQTISQPYVVGIMTQELAIEPGQCILEIGTGTGYQTALLARLTGPAGCVYTIERVRGLAKSAQRRLTAIGVQNVRYLIGDGSCGWAADVWDGKRSASGQPLFERILVTAGAPAPPAPLIEQLDETGIMVAPIGSTGSQQLIRLEKREGRVISNAVLECRFVPLVGIHAWPRASNDSEETARAGP